MDFGDFLRGTPNRLGGFIDNRFSGIGDFFKNRVAPNMPGYIVSPMADQRQIQPQQQQPTPTQQQPERTTEKFLGMKGKENKKEQGPKDKMTIKKDLGEQGTVTISMDLPQPQQEQQGQQPQQPQQPTPTPTVLPEFQGVQPELQNQIRGAFPDFPNEMINIGAEESSLRPDAINEGNPFIEEFGGSPRDLGLFQINEFFQQPIMRELGVTAEDLLDPEVNIAVARAIVDSRKKRGLNPFQPWVGAEKLGLTK